ncbi:MAG: winged helix-turn-helix transcriptional regulator [Clostridiales bacterium]|nr:winged helix-turn-helix transcriptional regulator [Clostridiales bacterium]
MKFMLAATESNMILLEINLDTKTALLGGTPFPLTQQEYTLLVALAKHPNEPISRENLLQAAWGYAAAGGTRTVDVHIQRLRKKLGIPCIETVFRKGYLLRAQEAD